MKLAHPYRTSGRHVDNVYRAIEASPKRATLPREDSRDGEIFVAVSATVFTTSLVVLVAFVAGWWVGAVLT